MNSGIYFALIAAFTFGIWTVLHQLASDKINPVLGAIVVSGAAVIFGLIFLAPEIGSDLKITKLGILFLVLAGVCAFLLDYFALRAYNSGLAISIAGPIIMGGSIAVASFIGFFLGDKISLMKVLGILLILVGTVILSAIA